MKSQFQFIWIAAMLETPTRKAGRIRRQPF